MDSVKKKRSKFYDARVMSFDEIAKLPIVSESSMILGFLRYEINEEKKRVEMGFLWNPWLFITPDHAMPDELRRSIVEHLRYHADKLESHEIDKRMQEVMQIVEEEDDDDEDSKPN